MGPAEPPLLGGLRVEFEVGHLADDLGDRDALLAAGARGLEAPHALQRYVGADRVPHQRHRPLLLPERPPHEVHLVPDLVLHGEGPLARPPVVLGVPQVPDGRHARARRAQAVLEANNEVAIVGGTTGVPREDEHPEGSAGGPPPPPRPPPPPTPPPPRRRRRR